MSNPSMRLASRVIHPLRGKFVARAWLSLDLLVQGVPRPRAL
jgi:hypothetical protein